MSAATKALDPDRLRRLLDLGRSLHGELRLDPVLQRLLRTAREITGARFAAIGVLDDSRTGLARFLTDGLEEEDRARIGDLPRGRGILGALIEEPRPLRLDDLREDPRSFGFPPDHPPMRTFLGVPILVDGRAWGNLYLTEKAGGAPFDDADEASVVVLADWAAMAIENARLYERLRERHVAQEQALRGFRATAAIARAVGAETDPGRVLELVAGRARALVGARAVVVLLLEGDVLRRQAAAGDVGASEDCLPLDGSPLGWVLTSQRSLRVDELRPDVGIDAGALGVEGARSALVVPLVYRERSVGVLAAFDRYGAAGGFTPADEEAFLAFAASAATAVTTARTVEADRLRHSIRAAEAERRRWARELHDETLQGLGGLKVVLSSAARVGDPDELRVTVGEALDHVTREIENLRAIITELRPAALDELGLSPALEALARRVEATEGLDVVTDVRPTNPDRRLHPDLETTVYRVAQEALTNAAKHARATCVELRLVEDADRVVLEIADDGIGIDPGGMEREGGFGLVGIRERVELADGQLAILPRPGGGTRVVADLPKRLA